MSRQPISCQLYDFVEIACVYGYDIRLILDDDQAFEGQALTTRTSEDKKEYLIIQRANSQQSIELSQIKSMQALTQNPHFNLITF